HISSVCQSFPRKLFFPSLSQVGILIRSGIPSYQIAYPVPNRVGAVACPCPGSPSENWMNERNLVRECLLASYFDVTIEGLQRDEYGQSQLQDNQMMKEPKQ